MFLKYVNTIEYVYFASSYYIYIFIHAKNSYWYGFQKYSCPALALAAIGGKNKACSGGNGGTTLQNKGCVGSCGNGWRRVFWQLIPRKWKYEPICQFKLSVLLCILCKCNCRRSISQCKSATQFAPQKYVSLITEKFPKEEGGQWPTSVTHFAKVTYLRPPPTRLFHSPTLRRLGLCCDRSEPPRGRDVEQSSPRPDWIQNRQAHPGGRSQKLPPEAEQTRSDASVLWCQNPGECQNVSLHG